MDKRQQLGLRHEMTRKSVPYQLVKYILLLLSIMIVTTTAIVTIIVCLLPTIIYEKKLSVESALNFLETGNLLPQQERKYGFRTLTEQQEADLVQLTSKEIETIRVIRFAILGLSAGIILNQTLAVYGLFRERTCYILLSSTFIGLVGQISLFVLPAPIFLLIVLYLTFSISFVILLNHFDSQAKLPPGQSQIISRPSSTEPHLCGPNSRQCCCRCKGCLCNPTSPFGGPPMTATINPNRKTSIPFSQTPLSSGAGPYYYGSLGRKSRESRLYLSQLQAMKANEAAASDMYGQRSVGPRLNSTAASLKPTNKFTNLAMDNFKSPYATVRRESTGYNYANLDRINNSTMI